MNGPPAVAPEFAAAQAVVLVEGLSDRIALETLAELRGRDLAADGVAIVPIGGAHAVTRFLNLYGPRGLGLRVAGLCDAGEERHFRRAFEHAGLPPEEDVHVCVPDLEGELIRALTPERVLEVVREQGDLHRFQTLQKQPEWRDRERADQLRRWMGSGGRRKLRYARYLVEALDESQGPLPLDAVLARV